MQKGINYLHKRHKSPLKTMKLHKKYKFWTFIAFRGLKSSEIDFLRIHSKNMLCNCKCNVNVKERSRVSTAMYKITMPTNKIYSSIQLKSSSSKGFGHQ